ncbi:MAG: hypothetical protein ACOVQ4_07185 [Flectobacillus sp.]|uniref:hypothetical protein n=1 Tax=Flectobacillus sp. TaxID=50419 RepID=UPI003B9BA8CB
MEQFKIRQDGFKEIRNMMLLKATPISLIAAFGGLLLSHFNTNEQQSNVNVFPYVIPMILGALAFGLYRSINRQKEIFESYRLRIDDNGITREQLNTPTITIKSAEVSEIIKNSNGSFTIKGKSFVDIIGVPSQIDNYEKLEKALANIKQISTKNSEPYLQKFRGILSILLIGLMALVYISKDKIIVGISGTVLLAMLGYSVYEVQKSKNIDSKTKKGMWWLIFVIASLIVGMYYKLTGQQ